MAPSQLTATKASLKDAQALWQQVGKGTWMHEHDKSSGIGNPFEQEKLALIESQTTAVKHADELRTVGIATEVIDMIDMDCMI